MSWDARQRAMLEAMGLKVWTRAEPPIVPESADAARAPLPAVATPPEPRAPQQAIRPPVETGERAPLARPAIEALPPLPSRPAAEPAAAEPDQAARRGEILAMDWPALRTRVDGCRDCTLCETRRQPVFGVGHEHAHWMIVGEAPGEQEDLKGEPFVGPAGQLLDAMLRAVGLGRGDASPEQQVFIANTLKCRPPRNRNPEPQELQRCAPYLERQIALVKPRIILAMGRFAVQSLLQSGEAIGRLRGQVHRYQGIPVIVSYHPAYLLRNLADKARAWEDLCLARDTYLQALAGGEAGQ